jgi:hypothetical protein
MTDQFQPLDRKIFGVLKAHAKHLFLQRIKERPRLGRTKGDAVQDLVEAWARLLPSTIEEAWDCYLSE